MLKYVNRWFEKTYAYAVKISVRKGCGFFMNISTNLKAIDTLKSSVLCEIARLYGAMANHDTELDEHVIEEGIASVIAMCYMLSKRLGFDYSDIDLAMCEILSYNTEENSNDETFTDMESLNSYISKNRKIKLSASR